MDDLKMLIAFLFNRKGKSILPARDLELAISMDLHWFSPTEAHEIINNAKKADLLLESNGELRPTFDLSTLQVPIGFKPGAKVLRPPTPPPPFLQIVNRIVGATELTKQAVIAEINQKREQMGTEIEIAGLLVAKHHGVDVSDLYTVVETLIFDRASGAI